MVRFTFRASSLTSKKKNSASSASVNHHHQYNLPFGQENVPLFSHIHSCVVGCN